LKFGESSGQRGLIKIGGKRLEGQIEKIEINSKRQVVSLKRGSPCVLLRTIIKRYLAIACGHELS